MVAATAPYLAWLNATAGQAQETAAQARAAASAFEAAFAATVPPPVIAANRLLLATLTATNILGINTPAIATTEAHYFEMWAQDAAAMYGYAGASAVASTLTQFTPPAGHAVSPAQTTSTQVTSAVPQALQRFAQPLQSSNSSLSLSDGLDNLSSFVSPASSCASTLSSSMSATSSLSTVVKAFSRSAALASTAVDGEVKALGSALPGVLGSGTGIGGPAAVVSAELGNAVPIGQLSVPQSWATAALTRSATPLAGAGLGQAPAVGVSGAGNMLGGMPIASMAPRGEGGPSGAVPRAGFRPSVLSREGIGG
ncbi:MAG: hypothetical protein QOH91_1026 [Mycobacterium sp.]|jgi:PPE-repeat protein|nr:hypothetical protein [Mycobacterium sp.]